MGHQLFFLLIYGKKNCKVAYDLDVKAFFKLFFEKQFPDFKEDAKALIEYEYRTCYSKKTATNIQYAQEKTFLNSFI